MSSFLEAVIFAMSLNAEKNGGSSYNMNNKSRSTDVKYTPPSSSSNMNQPNGAISNINTGAYCGNTSRMPHLSKVNFEREVQRRFTNKRENMSRAERYEIEKRINKPLDLKYQ
ncbi:uncharacterized protein LOC134817894 isoform X1 [Bolinopsis microptera]|uniref:uncharacterized protein LOC134817894 isoform X1 n=1 Tax=Bolinopsis microptera TaxID=2820187 RepID=UPI003079035F